MGGDGLGRYLDPPPPQQIVLLYALFSVVVGDLGSFIDTNVPLDAVLHFDLHAAILGWLLTAVQPKLQHRRHNYPKVSKLNN